MVLNRRSEIEIIWKILDLSRNGAKTTDLLYQCNLSYTQLKSYLPFLIEKEILKEEVVESNGSLSKFYRITEKGFLFLNDIRKVLAYLG